MKKIAAIAALAIASFALIAADKVPDTVEDVETVQAKIQKSIQASWSDRDFQAIIAVQDFLLGTVNDSRELEYWERGTVKEELFSVVADSDGKSAKVVLESKPGQKFQRKVRVTVTREVILEPVPEPADGHGVTDLEHSAILNGE